MRAENSPKGKDSYAGAGGAGGAGCAGGAGGAGGPGGPGPGADDDVLESAGWGTTETAGPGTCDPIELGGGCYSVDK